MTHAAMDADAQRAAGIGETLLRLSVGIEAVEDLVARSACRIGSRGRRQIDGHPRHILGTLGPLVRQGPLSA